MAYRLFYLIIFVLAPFLGSASQQFESNNGCPTIINRNQWGAQQAAGISYQTIPVKYVIINHTVTPRCNTKLKCSNILLGIQSYHMSALKGKDIPYNFLIGDNAIFEGTGWHKAGAHTLGYNSNSIGIGFIGTFSEELPTPDALSQTKKLLECAVNTGELADDYVLLGARQIKATESPGLELYNEIQEWEHWSTSA